MRFKQEQDCFDKIKWFDSISVGYDTCGSYVFCGCCHKDEANPCARAAYRYENGYVRIAWLRRRGGRGKV